LPSLARSDLSTLKAALLYTRTQSCMPRMWEGLMEAWDFTENPHPTVRTQTHADRAHALRGDRQASRISQAASLTQVTLRRVAVG